jgi:hypothetical protein
VFHRELGFEAAGCWRPRLPLRRVITSRIEDHLSEELLRGRISPGDAVVVDVRPGGGFTFRAEPGRKGNASEAS